MPRCARLPRKAPYFVLRPATATEPAAIENYDRRADAKAAARRVATLHGACTVRWRGYSERNSDAVHIGSWVASCLGGRLGWIDLVGEQTAQDAELGA